MRTAVCGCRLVFSSVAMSEERRPPPGGPDQEEISTNPAWEDLSDSGEELANATRTLRVDSGTLKVRRCRISVVAGPDAGLELVSDKERIRIGAHRSNDLVLSQDRTASRQHCEIHRTDRGYLLVDLDSTNGTLLEGRRIERAYLAAGSTIRAGLSTLVFTPMDEEVTVEPIGRSNWVAWLAAASGCARFLGSSRKS